MTPGTYCSVWLIDGDHLEVAAEDAPRIDAAVDAYLASGGTRDNIIPLTGAPGNEISVLASYVVGWTVTTPETRERRWERKAALDAESREYRHANGIFDADP